MQPEQCHCPVMCFYATRDIKAGEELLFDYAAAFGEDNMAGVDLASHSKGAVDSAAISAATGAS